MIQRIQSVYLLIVIILTSLLNGFSLMELISPESLLTVKVWGVYNGNVLDYSLWPLLVLLILNSILALIAIAIYKNRILQIRACILNILLIIGFYIMLDRKSVV